MKQNERILVYLVTGFLAVILVVAVMFGRDSGTTTTTASNGDGATPGLGEILGQKPKEPKADPAANAAGIAPPEQVVGQQPLVAGKTDIAAELVTRELGPSRRDRTVRFVRAKPGDSLDSIVRRWCGARDPFLDEAKALNEDLVVLRVGQEVAVPWVEDDAVYAAWQARQPQKPVVETADALGNGGAAPVPADAGAARLTFAVPGSGEPAADGKAGAAPAPAPAAGKPYTVKAGDSLWKIAERLYGRKQADRRIAEIRQLNPGLDDRLRPGQTFLVPAAAEATPGTPGGE